MRYATPKRAKQLRQYTKRRDVFMVEHPTCVCGRPSEELHHMRGRRGLDLLDEAHWLALCAGCHRQATVNPLWAKEQGLSENRVGRAS